MKLKKIVIILIVAIITCLILSVSLYFYGLTSVKSESDKVVITINSGTSVQDIVEILKDNNIIKSKIATYIYLVLNNDIILQAGTYELDRSDSTKEIIAKLNSGDVRTITVTFIEGNRLTKFVRTISEKFALDEKEIHNVLSDKNYLNELINKYEFLSKDILNEDIYYALEGYLFPSTYEFVLGSDIKTIIERMLDKTEEILGKYSEEIKNSDYSVHEILTMASIIENETGLDEDRAYVSQVIYTRLDKNMSLGMDTTSYYGVGKELTEPITSSDLNAKNAYNTRDTSFIGLPVGPICNPGEEAIEAALKPADTDYVYFFSDIKTGKSYFTASYSEFLEFKKIYG